MKSKFILITAILLSLLEAGFSQSENIKALLNSPAEYKKTFDRARKTISDLTESKPLENFQDNLVIYQDQIKAKNWENFFSGETRRKSCDLVLKRER